MKNILILLFCPFIIHAQIVNIEKERLADSLANHWAFSAELGFGLSNNTAGRNLTGEGEFRADYYFKEKNKLMLMGAIGVNRFKAADNTEVTDIENNQFLHLRYNRTLTSWLVWEAFTQGQVNEVEQVIFRWLIGSGPRFKIIDKEKGNMYFGSLYMFERSDEEGILPDGTVQWQHHRLSSYLSMFYQASENVTMSHVTYFQPRLDDFKDLRIATETGIEFTIIKNLKWRTYFECVYDSRPPFGVIDLRYELKNALSISFGED